MKGGRQVAAGGLPSQDRHAGVGRRGQGFGMKVIRPIDPPSIESGTRILSCISEMVVTSSRYACAETIGSTRRRARLLLL